MREAVDTDISVQDQANTLLAAHGGDHEATCHEIVRSRMIEALRHDDYDAYLYWREVDEVMSRNGAATTIRAC